MIIIDNYLIKIYCKEYKSTKSNKTQMQQQKYIVGVKHYPCLFGSNRITNHEFLIKIRECKAVKTNALRNKT